MRFPGNIVTLADTRSAGGAGTPDKCFYCAGKAGGEHEESCVCIHRPVKMRVTLDVIVSAPRSFTPSDIDFHRNESSWCASNFVRNELPRYLIDNVRCLCNYATFEYVGEATLEEAVAEGLTPDSDVDE